MAPPPRLPDEPPAVTDLGGEVERASGAMRFVADTLAGLARTADGPARDVLDAAAMMATDPTLAAAVARRVGPHRPAEWAIADALAEKRAELAGLGGYLAERAADLDDIRDRALAHLLG